MFLQSIDQHLMQNLSFEDFATYMKSLDKYFQYFNEKTKITFGTQVVYYVANSAE